MLNEHEIRERIHLANLELAGIIGTVGIIVERVNARLFTDAERSLVALKERATGILDLIEDLTG